MREQDGRKKIILTGDCSCRGWMQLSWLDAVAPLLPSLTRPQVDSRRASTRPIANPEVISSTVHSDGQFSPPLDGLPETDDHDQQMNYLDPAADPVAPGQAQYLDVERAEPVLSTTSFGMHTL